MPCASYAPVRSPRACSSGCSTRAWPARSGYAHSNLRPCRAEGRGVTLKLRDGVSTADTDYGIALLDEDSGQYFNLNPTAALALRTLLDGGTTAQAAKELAEQYAVDADTANKDVEDLLVELRSVGL